MRNYELMLELRQAQWEEVCLGGRREGEDKDDLEDGQPPGLGLGQLDKWRCHQGYEEGRRRWFGGGQISSVSEILSLWSPRISGKMTSGGLATCDHQCPGVSQGHGYV